ncbi:hypothetical protein FA15DRAFT_598914 [Coprinopsis marcescibilis]|uniref:DUF6570 domain-containing protein n=1 Tax=Coprinopsis marcescibilis TaxID=230819 RepID=A0A5C3KKY6_COPMA|nr:hypothetical protein FA15DRAFT_598914 [Coprinopsis marcescibilis]
MLEITGIFWRLELYIPVELPEPFFPLDTEQFPPEPAFNSLIGDIISNYCNNTSSAKFEENGCAVCGQLTPISQLTNINSSNVDLSCLISESHTQKERKHGTDTITGVTTPAIDHRCDSICNSCLQDLRNNKMPKYSLANGLWIGEIPKELQDLMFAEQILISHVRHN